MKYLLAILFGAIASLSFEPIGFWLAAFFALAGWYTLLVRNGLISRMGISYLFGACLLFINQYWTGIYVGNVPLIILALSQALIFMVPALFVTKDSKYNNFSFALSYVLLELLLRTIPFTGFGWSRLSFTQVDSPLSALYTIGGVALVALVLAWISSARKLLSLTFALLVVLLCWFIPSTVQPQSPISIALIQGGVVDLGLDFNSKPQEVFKRHLEQTTKSVRMHEVDLVIWPENAVDVDINTNPKVNDSIINLSENLKTPILVGAVTKSSEGPKNQSLLYDPEIVTTYTKRYLTPFGEYLPLRSFAERVSKYSNQIIDFKAGDKNAIFRSNNFTFSTLICYELLNDSFVSESINNFLIIQTNNATFGNTNQLDQQLNIAKVRALESGRNIAYVSTTGITAFISNQGEVFTSLEKFEPGTLKGQISTIQGSTYRQSYGLFVEPLSLIILLGLRVLRVRRDF
jgi:apolipoprotein N-acyltransferase